MHPWKRVKPMTLDSLSIIGRRGILSNARPKVAFVLGIRPDLVRAAPLFAKFKELAEFDVTFIWSGQHYSTNLKDSFLQELAIPAPDLELQIDTNDDISIVSSGIKQLGQYLASSSHDCVMFLGDTNTVLLSLAPSILNIPIVHIEGCMRSFDIEMPEERNRRMIDKISSRIYAYLPRYKSIGMLEGIPENSIVITGNLAVDAVQYFIGLKSWQNFEARALMWRNSKGVNGEYALMTCHRRENINNEDSLRRILDLAGKQNFQVIFAAGYATQRKIVEFGVSLPVNVIMTDPLEYSLFLPSLMGARLVITDSGTVVEESSILGIPSFQIRRSTERPEVYWSGSSIKIDPHNHSPIPSRTTFPDRWNHELGLGNASTLIIQDLNEWFASGMTPDGRVVQSTYSFEAWGTTRDPA
jgi:UDP-N-acetylglucosamine 2-epimerase (non-hydrolysing)